MIKRISTITITLVLIFSLFGCTSSNDKIDIVTTLFPQYDFAKAIVGDNMNVMILLPPGVEAHAYEPTPKDIINTNNAKLFIYTGEFMETWADNLIEDLKKRDIPIVRSADGINLIFGHNGHEDEHESEVHEDEDSDEIDPHIWLDPENAKIMINNILKAIIEIDPENKSIYEENARLYIEKIDQMSIKYEEFFHNNEDVTIIYAGHFAFGYLANRYHFDYISPYEGFSPDAEPLPSKISQLIDTMRQLDSKYIFFEEMIEPSVAKVLSNETGAKMLLLHGIHNISKEDKENGVTYVDLMLKNLESLKEGVGNEE